MNFNVRQNFCGYKFTEIKSFLTNVLHRRELADWNIFSLCKWTLGTEISTRLAKDKNPKADAILDTAFFNVINVCLAYGFLESSEVEMQGEKYTVFHVTKLGAGLANAKRLKRLDREKASTFLDEFLSKVAEANKDKEQLCEVEKIILIGSMLNSEAKSVGDIDLLVKTRGKNKSRDDFFECCKRQMQKDGKQMTHLWYLYPEEKLLKFIKNNNQYISLISFEQEKVLNCKKAVIFQNGKAMDWRECVYSEPFDGSENVQLSIPQELQEKYTKNREIVFDMAEKYFINTIKKNPDYFWRMHYKLYTKNICHAAWSAKKRIAKQEGRRYLEEQDLCIYRHYIDANALTIKELFVKKNTLDDTTPCHNQKQVSPSK